MDNMSPSLINAINRHGDVVFGDADGTCDLESGIQLIDLIATMIEEMSDLHLIPQAALSLQLRHVEMLLKIGLDLAEDKIEYLNKQLTGQKEALANA